MKTLLILPIISLFLSFSLFAFDGTNFIGKFEVNYKDKNHCPNKIEISIDKHNHLKVFELSNLYEDEFNPDSKNIHLIIDLNKEGKQETFNDDVENVLHIINQLELSDKKIKKGYSKKLSYYTFVPLSYDSVYDTLLLSDDHQKLTWKKSGFNITGFKCRYNRILQ